MVTVTSNRYVTILCEFLQPKLNEFENQQIWFLQDGATAHMARTSMDALREFFPGCLISQRADIPWLMQLPDLAICDYFLWGYFKTKVFMC